MTFLDSQITAEPSGETRQQKIETQPQNSRMTELKTQPRLTTHATQIIQNADTQNPAE